MAVHYGRTLKGEELADVRGPSAWAERWGAAGPDGLNSRFREECGRRSHHDGHNVLVMVSYTTVTKR
jgi:hypothetical protein